MRKCFVFICTLLPVWAGAQTYALQVLSAQSYTEITQPDYEIPDTSPYFGNVNTKPDMYFTAFGSSYDLYDNVFIPIKQGYAYFVNNTRSTTVYGARGLFVARPGTGQTSVFSFKTTGSGPTANFTMQWKNIGFEKGDQNDYINFQVKLYGTTGVIEFCFGPNAVKNALWEDNANGPSIGLLEMDPNFSTIYRQLWLTGNAASPVVNTSTAFAQLSNVPANGMVYRFTPSVTGLQEASAGSIYAYPNPATDKIWLSAEAGEWQLLDAAGALQKSGSGIPPQGIDISNLAAGTYILQLTAETGTSHIKVLKR